VIGRQPLSAIELTLGCLTEVLPQGRLDSIYPTG